MELSEESRPSEADHLCHKDLKFWGATTRLRFILFLRSTTLSRDSVDVLTK